MKKFRANGWIHPINGGGDDEEFEVDISATTKAEAKKFLIKWLKRKSAVWDNFIIKEK